jgi:hypothetical protein
MVARELPNNPLAAACETEADPDFETDHNFLEKQMKIKTSELTGAALDWAVAKCDGPNSMASCYYDEDAPVCLEEWPESLWEPSTNWAQGGPIIEREWIDLHCVNDSLWEVECPAPGGLAMQNGPTPLIAAMRCYCASKLGHEVDVPDELC